MHAYQFQSPMEMNPMATKQVSFHFTGADPHLACRIANLITSDIEALDKHITGTSRAITSFPKPLKAHYAMDIADRLMANDAQRQCAFDLLPSLEAKAKKYIQDREGSRGHPFVQFIHSDEGNSMEKTIETSYANANDAAVKAIIDDNVPVGAAKETKQSDTKANDSDSQDAPVEIDDEQAAALAALIKAVQPKKQKAVVDPKEVERLVNEAVAKAGLPKAITVTVQSQDKTETKDMGLQHKQFPALLKLIQAGFPVWIPGPAGSGKTTAVHNVAKAINATLFMPPEGPIENKYGMIGFENAAGKFMETTLYKASKLAAENPEQRVIYFIDECDAGYPNALLVLNAVMENGYCTFANGERIEYGRNLQFIAGANTWGNGATHEYVGRNKVDAATLDRFVMLAWAYDEALEKAIAGDTEFTRYVQKVRAKVQQSADIKHVVSPRASIRGNALLKQGMDWNDVVECVVRKGLPVEAWNRIK